MKKTIGIFAALACAVAICFALVGCGGASAEDEKAFVGKWELNSIVSSSGSSDSITQSDVELMKSLGMSLNLTLNADKTAEFDMFGEVTKCEWKCKGPKEATLTISGQKVDLSIDDSGKLLMAQSGDVIAFSKAADSGTKA